MGKAAGRVCTVDHARQPCQPDASVVDEMSVAILVAIRDNKR
jgi:hypothetical protein